MTIEELKEEIKALCETNIKFIPVGIAIAVYKELLKAREENEKTNKAYNVLSDEYKGLSHECEDSKCCGNCGVKNSHCVTCSDNYKSCWQSDNKTKQQREV